MAVKNAFLYRLLLRVVPLGYDLLSRLLFATCRFQVHGADHSAWCAARSAPCIALFWHYSLLPVVELLRRKGGAGWVAMVSASDDAEFVARILAHKGCATVRGSRNRGGLTALKGLIGWMQKGYNAAIVADGSQGPARCMQPGALFLASRTGAPILPLVVAVDRYWLFRSWDRTLLPKPFARIHIRFGKPLQVPEKLSAQGMEAYRQEMEDRLNALYTAAWREFAQPGHDEC